MRPTGFSAPSLTTVAVTVAGLQPGHEAERHPLRAVQLAENRLAIDAGDKCGGERLERHAPSVRRVGIDRRLGVARIPGVPAVHERLDRVSGPAPISGHRQGHERLGALLALETCS